MTEAHKICVEFISAYFTQDQESAFSFANKLLKGKIEPFCCAIWLDGCSNDAMNDECCDTRTEEVCEGRINPLFCMKHKTELKR